jgi:hypothetical protein
MYYDPEGFPIPADGPFPGFSLPATLAWARMKDAQEPVALDELPDGSCLSTTWLGLDHSHGFGPPLIFETMRFAAATETFVMPGSGREVPYGPPLPFPVPGGEPDEETEQLRYTTKEEALAAHHEIRRRLVLRLGS